MAEYKNFKETYNIWSNYKSDQHLLELAARLNAMENFSDLPLLLEKAQKRASKFYQEKLLERTSSESISCRKG